MTMAELLASHKTTFVTFNKGDIVTGIITKLTPAEILVDVDAKTEAVVLEKDRKILKTLLSTLKVGDSVQVSILDPESDRGNPVVSLRRFIGDLSWKKLSDFKENKKEVEVLVTEATKGGYLVQTDEGLSGFLPNSHILHNLNPQDAVSKKIKVFVLELIRPEHKIIFSQKALLGAEDFGKAIRDFKKEQKIDAIITNLTPFGIFVSIQNSKGETIDGLIHISEISWKKVENVQDLFSSGQKIEAVIIGFDKDAKRVDLSIKRLTADPFEEKSKKFSQDQKVSGKVLKIISTGIILELEDGVEGFIRKEKVPPNVSYSQGEEMNVTVSEVDRKKHRIILVPVLLEKPIGYR